MPYITLNLTLNDSGAVTGTWQAPPLVVMPTPTPALTPAPSAGLPGTVIGTTGSYDGKSAREKAFDGDPSTFFDAPNPGTADAPNWVGLDLGAPHQITGITFAARVNFKNRMVGGSFQASNDPAFASGTVILAVVVAEPADNYVTIPVIAPGAYRYVRYLSPPNGYGNIAELSFAGVPSVAATPTPIPTTQPTPAPVPVVVPTPTPPPATTAGGTAFAMCSDALFLTDSAYPPALLATGARTVRLDASFRDVRAQPGDDPSKWNLSTFDRIRAIKSKYPPLDFLAILGYGVDWAATPATTGKGTASLPRGIDLAWDDPGNLYAAYVYQAVSRNKDVIKFWESWNEPDLPGRQFFAGDGRDFFPYQKACYLAAKAADPTCTVLLAGLTYASPQAYVGDHQPGAPARAASPNSFLEQFLQRCVADPDAAKNNYYFDAWNQHPYSRASDGYDNPIVLRAAGAAYGISKSEVWLTETGISDADAGPWDCTPAEYCDYLLQLFAWSTLSGVAKLFHFQIDNSVPGNGLYKGELGDPKPALITYRDVLTAEFSGVTSVRQIHGNPGVGYLSGGAPSNWAYQSGWNGFVFECDDGKRRMMAWSDTSAAIQVKLPATKASATLIDRNNVRTTIGAVGGSYAVTLAGATNLRGSHEHLMGGSTVVIVEPA